MLLDSAGTYSTYFGGRRLASPFRRVRVPILTERQATARQLHLKQKRNLSSQTRPLQSGP